MTTVTFPDQTIRRATATLNAAVRSWFVVASLGQLVFAVAVASFYGLTAARGDLHRWTISGGWKPGDIAGNLSVAMHLATAVIVMTSGSLQLIPRVRARHPRFHRWNGRVYVLAGLVLSAAGVYMTWFRSTLGDVPQHLASTLNAVLIWAFAAIAVRYAIRRDFAAHRRWALRFFLVLSASYFYRLSFFLVVVLAGHPVGFDPTTFTGWLPTTMSFTQYLLPLGALELYLRAQANPNALRRFVTAGVLFVMTLATAAGILVVTAANWLPDVRHGFDFRPSIAVALSSTIEKRGIEAALQQYRELKAARGTSYNFDEAELNSLGYQFLRRKQMTDAIRIFQLNVEAYPKSSNAYDSLGEALARAGNKTQAIAYYQKSISLNPKNYNAAAMVEKLRGRA